MKYFHVFIFPEEAELAPTSAAGVAPNGNMKENRSDFRNRTYNR